MIWSSRTGNGQHDTYNLFTSKYVYIAWLYGPMKHKSAWQIPIGKRVMHLNTGNFFPLHFYLNHFVHIQIGVWKLQFIGYIFLKENVIPIIKRK
jgi:hypothetical protein